jgi:hypothetical protein
VIIPCYRQAHYLAEAIESVLVQTYPHVEVVVVDDGSPDNTTEIAARYPGVRCIRQPNRGVSQARNFGIRRSNGTFVIFSMPTTGYGRPRSGGPDCLRDTRRWRSCRPTSVHRRRRHVSGKATRSNAGTTQQYCAELHYGSCAAMCRRDVRGRRRFNPAFSVVADYEFYLRVLKVSRAESRLEVASIDGTVSG